MNLFFSIFDSKTKINVTFPGVNLQQLELIKNKFQKRINLIPDPISEISDSLKLNRDLDILIDFGNGINYHSNLYDTNDLSKYRIINSLKINKLSNQSFILPVINTIYNGEICYFDIATGYFGAYNGKPYFKLSDKIKGVIQEFDLGNIVTLNYIEDKFYIVFSDVKKIDNKPKRIEKIVTFNSALDKLLAIDTLKEASFAGFSIFIEDGDFVFCTTGQEYKVCYFNPEKKIYRYFIPEDSSVEIGILEMYDDEIFFLDEIKGLINLSTSEAIDIEDVAERIIKSNVVIKSIASINDTEDQVSSFYKSGDVLFLIYMLDGKEYLSKTKENITERFEIGKLGFKLVILTVSTDNNVMNMVGKTKNAEWYQLSFSLDGD